MEMLCIHARNVERQAKDGCETVFANHVKERLGYVKNAEKNIFLSMKEINV
jgi:hypothetical protein